jgi:ABC-type dipeptide/oligopeptide/nickel transport system permease component
MLAYLLNRLAQLVPFLVGCSLLVFLALQLLPGDAAQVFLGERDFTQEDYQAMREYLGLGVDPTLPTWGRMLRAGGPYLRLYPHLAVFPGLLIMLAVLGFNAMGDAIRDILDPRMLSRVRGGRTG